jgi:hypothetical protein
MLPTRQIHLDFHTAPYIPDVGADFSPDEFMGTLQSAHINSITVFAKCHHGYSYYPTRVGIPHPNLTRPDLLGEMVKACKVAGVRVVAYVTAVWDELAWETHPEWRQVSTKGQYVGPAVTPFVPGWKNLCLNSGYAEYVTAQVREILDTYPVDGVFIDIVNQIGGPCACSTCKSQMQVQGVNPLDELSLNRFSLEAERNFMRKVTSTIRAHSSETQIFYNSRLRIEWDPELGNQAELENFSHLEIESLPGGFWGYSHFPLYVRYFQTFNKPMIAMNGRFHTAWGDFGGLRNRAALEFECFQALAHGVGCSIGDQLHPSGKLDAVVYERIGDVYAAIEQRESWCINSVALPEIGVMTSNGGPGQAGNELHSEGDSLPLSDLGVLNILEQLKYQFQFLDAGSDLTPYGLVILPDKTTVDESLAAKIRVYLENGGKLLVTGNSGLVNGEFLLSNEMGVNYRGNAPFAPDYLALDSQIWTDIEAIPPVCELQGQQVALRAGTRVLAYSGAPYFNRTWEHFCSHQYTPLKEITDNPVITEYGNIIYVARPLFHEYALNARKVHRQVIEGCIRRLLPGPRVGTHNLPSTAIVTVRRQELNLIVHLLHYIPQRRGKYLDVIEDVIPLYESEVSIRAENKPLEVNLVPQGEALPFEWRDGYVKFTVPKINGYQIVCLTGAAK